MNDAARAIRKEQGGDALIVLSHADGSVTIGNTFGSFYPGGFSATGTAVNIPRRQDRAKVIVIKWK